MKKNSSLSQKHKSSRLKKTEKPEIKTIPIETFNLANNRIAQNKLRDIKPGVIQSLTFQIASTEDIKGFDRPKIFLPDKNTTSGAVQDLRLGPPDKNSVCGRCDKGVLECKGHHGYIELAVPILNPAYAKTVLKLMNLFCYNHFEQSEKARIAYRFNFTKSKSQGKVEDDPLYPKHDIEPLFDTSAVEMKWSSIKGIDRIKLVEKELAGKCPREEVVIKYSLNVHNQIVRSIDKLEDIIEPKYILEFLKAIDADAVKGSITQDWHSILGFGNNLFQSLVFEVFPIISNVFRQNKTEQDIKSDLTISYSNIVAKNNEVAQLKSGNENIGVKEKLSKVAEHEQKKVTEAHLSTSYKQLNEEVINFFFAKDDATTNNYGKSVAAKSINLHVGGKKGVFRRDVMGKGGDFSGRTVIIGDPCMKINEVGMSDEMSNSITTEEDIMSDEDIDRWITYFPDFNSTQIMEGTIKAITKSNGRYVYLTKDNITNVSLEIGDKIHRGLISGDPITISRQPVLHKGGVMGFFVKVIKNAGNVLRIHPSVTGPFNADFDGDEMNFAVPQEYSSKADVLSKLMLDHCLRGDQYSAPWVGAIQNTVVGAHVLSFEETKFSRQLFHLVADFVLSFYEENDEDGIFRTNKKEFLEQVDSYKYAIDPYSGKSLFSCFLPKNFNYKRKNVKIVDGIIIDGELTKSDVGKSSKGIPDSILEMYGARANIMFLSALSQGIYIFIENYGMTTSKRDVVLEKSETCDRQKTIDEILDDVREQAVLLAQNSQGTPLLAKLAEAQIEKNLALAVDRVNEIVKAGGVNVVKIRNKMENERNLLKGEKSDLKDVLEFVLSLVKDDESGKKLLLNLISLKNKTYKQQSDTLNLLDEIDALKLAGKLLLNAKQEDLQKFIKNAENLTIKFQTLPLEKIQQEFKTKFQSMINDREELTGANKFTNNFLKVVYSGAKGTPVNVTQVMGVIGQQQKSLIQKHDVTKRSLPFFPRNEFDPVANGFCASSFSQGLRPEEFFHHAQASRGNMQESNLKPSVTGYFYRRLWIMMIDSMAYSDGSIRDEVGRVVQFAYGGDMFDPRRLMNITDGEPEFINIELEIMNLNE